nr:hypothetical protein [Bradyrhizobium japonicum]
MRNEPEDAVVQSDEFVIENVKVQTLQIRDVAGPMKGENLSPCISDDF